MNHSLELVLTLAAALTAALVLGYATQRMRLSPIVGYLLAGIAIGPFTPGFVAQTVLAQELAEIGIVLLMFGVGLQFHLEDLLSVRKVAVPGAMIAMCATAGLGALVGSLFGQGGWFFGITIAISSTVVLLRVLSDRDVLHTPAGRTAVGWLVVEDVLTVVLLVLLPALGGKGNLFVSIGLALLKVAALVVFTLAFGSKIIPRILGWIVRTRARDLFTLSVLVIALGIAIGSAKLFGASMALGAFLAGMVVGRSEFASRAASEALPMRDAFAVLFFVSIGMLLDPRELVTHAPIIGFTLAAIVIGKPLVAFGFMRVARQSPGSALTVALALGQIGEFSFIVATLGRELGVLPASAMPIIVATSIFSISINPLLVQLALPLGRMLGGSSSLGRVPAPRADVHRTIVVGYGPVGQTVTRLLRDHRIEPTVIELNHDTVRELIARDISAVHGDASQRTILEAAGIAHARSLIFAASGSPAEAVTRLAKEMNPKIRILARSTYVREIAPTKAAGADVVVTSEVEVALAMTEEILSALGATNEQLDQARALARRSREGNTLEKDASAELSPYQS